MEEFKLHDLIIKDTNVQKDICSIIGSDFDKCEFIHEDSYINEITADFTIKQENCVKAIIECKGSNISVTDYVRGIGQIMQYENFIDKKLSTKGYEFDCNAKPIFCFPSSLIRNCKFNIGLLKYPEKAVIIEVNDSTHAVREITRDELNKLEQAQYRQLVTISQYYIRDNRMYELYILLKHLSYLKLKGETECNRSKMEQEFLMKLETHNNRNWRNAFISLASLGFINTDNMPTSIGISYGAKDYEEFASDVFETYLSPYVEQIFKVLELSGNSVVSLNNTKICEEIRNNFRGRDVLFLTESDGRYMSSWLNILRDDYGCIDFAPRNSTRTIKYNPCKFNKNSLKEEIKKNSIAYEYIDRYYSLIK